MRYRVCIEPRFGAVGVLLRLGLLPRFGRDLDRLFRDAADAAIAGQEQAFPKFAARGFPAAARKRVAARAKAVADQGYGAASRLAAHLLEASDNDVERMRPRALARRWRMEPRSVIETCLAAAREGLLILRWDLICPRCRGAKVAVRSLDELPRGAHCPTCNIPYDRDFSRNVEVTFDPADDIRPLAVGAYCLASPIAADHIKVQQRLASGGSATIDVELANGDYRARTVEPGGVGDFAVADGAVPEIILGDGGPVIGPAERCRQLHARNAGTCERTLVDRGP